MLWAGRMKTTWERLDDPQSGYIHIASSLRQYYDNNGGVACIIALAEQSRAEQIISEKPTR